MKALTLTQPWATLAAIGAKRFETRSWRTGYCGTLLIHAAKNFPKECRKLAYHEEPFRTALGSAARIPTQRWGMVEENLPCGKIIAVTSLRYCTAADNALCSGRIHGVSASEHEEAFGAFSPGRYAFALGAVYELDRPVECRGALGLWTPPPSVVAAVKEQIADRVLAEDGTL